MRSLFIAIIIFVSFYGCGDDKIDLSAIGIDREITVKNSPSQNFDSIVTFNTNRVINSTGDSVFNITTSENRRESSLKNKPADTLDPVMTHYSYSLNEAVYFIITIYDSSGLKLIELVNDRFSKGMYEVHFAIYSILKPGTYISAVSHQNSDQYFKIIVN